MEAGRGNAWWKNLKIFTRMSTLISENKDCHKPETSVRYLGKQKHKENKKISLGTTYAPFIVADRIGLTEQLRHHLVQAVTNHSVVLVKRNEVKSKLRRKVLYHDKLALLTGL